LYFATRKENMVFMRLEIWSRKG